MRRLFPECRIAVAVLLAFASSVAIAATARAQDDEVPLAELFTRAERRVAGGQPDRALAIYHEIVERDPTNPDAWYNLGELSRAMGQPEDCVRYFARLLYLVPAERVDVGTVMDGCVADMPAGHLTVSAAPEQAEIAVDGLVLGEGRLDALPLPAGPHDVRVEAYDYVPRTERVEIVEGEPIDLTIALEPVLYYGTLEIGCDHAGAAVTLDDDSVGTTPLAGPLRIQARRPYLVRLTLDGYYDWVRRIEIEPDESHVLEVTMQEVDPWEQRFRDR